MTLNYTKYISNTRKGSKLRTYHAVTSHHPLPACWVPHRSSTWPLHSLHSLITTTHSIVATFDCLIKKTLMGGNLRTIDYLFCNSLLQLAEGNYCTLKKIILNLKNFFLKLNKVKIVVMTSGGSSMGHVGQCPPKENVEMTFLHSN